MKAKEAGAGWITIGFIAKQWDEQPTVSIATSYFALPLSIFQKESSRPKLRPGQLAYLLIQALRANLLIENLGQFAALLSDFLNQDQIIAGFVNKGHSAFIVTMKVNRKGDAYKLRVSYAAPEKAVLTAMNVIGDLRVYYGHNHIPAEQMHTFDFRPEDEFITGKIEVHDGLAMMNGKEDQADKARVARTVSIEATT